MLPFKSTLKNEYAKGQKISKAIFLSFNSSKKSNEKIVIISMLASKLHSTMGQIKKS